MMEKLDKDGLKKNLFGRIVNNPKVTKENVTKEAENFKNVYEYYLEHGELPPKEQVQDQELDK